MQITVTKPHVPSRKRLDHYLNKVLESRWLTNYGPLVRELTARLEDYLGVKHLLLTTNGTMGLLIGLKVAGCRNIITTSFSFPATASAPLWSGVKVTFGDISPETFNMVPPPLSNSDNFDGILATHVFGNPCDVAELKRTGDAWQVPVIYDAAHAFEVRVEDRSILNFGDMSMLSFHAPKLFHCVEGGAVKFSDESQYLAAREFINFRYDPIGEIQSVGINAKMNEFQAAMGLAVFDEIDEILLAYKERYQLYDELLSATLQRQRLQPSTDHNYSYFPICFPTPALVTATIEQLNESNIFARRYFFPSLDTVKAYHSDSVCPVSRDVASRILCLPMYSDLPEGTIREICRIINRVTDH